MRTLLGIVPPIDEPWSFFDLAEIQMYLGDAEAGSTLEEGLRRATAEWMPKTLLDSLSLLPAGSVDGLDRLANLARRRVEDLGG